MIKIIEGKKYNTETAKLVGVYWGNSNHEEFTFLKESLYLKKTGEFFLHGEGGASTKYATSLYNNSWTAGERIIPLSFLEAKNWAKKHLEDEFEQYFGDIEETDSKKTVSFSLSEDIIEGIKRASSVREIPYSEFIEIMYRMFEREDISNKKILVGGYYDDRVFIGEDFYEITPFRRDVKAYTLYEALKLSFLEDIPNWYEDQIRDDDDPEWKYLSDRDKIDFILQYTENDEVAGIISFETEEDAMKYIEDVISELDELEQNIEYIGHTQDSYGVFRETYKWKSTEDEATEDEEE